MRASKIPSGVSLPCPSRMASEVIKWPTLRNEHEGSPRKGQGIAVEPFVDPVAVEGTLTMISPFGEGGGEGPLHQPQPVSVGHDLVRSVHGGDGVFAVHDGGDGCLHQEIFDARCIIFSYGTEGVKLELDVEAVFLEKDGRRGRGFTLVAHTLVGGGQAGAFAIDMGCKPSLRDIVAGCLGMGTCFKGVVGVEEPPGECNDRLAPVGIVGFGAGCVPGIRDYVRAIECIVEASPPGVGSVEGISGVHDGNHKLGPGN